MLLTTVIDEPLGIKTISNKYHIDKHSRSMSAFDSPRLEDSLEILEFSVDAKCAEGYHGAAKVPWDAVGCRGGQLKPADAVIARESVEY